MCAWMMWRRWVGPRLNPRRRSHRLGRPVVSSGLSALSPGVHPRRPPRLLPPSRRRARPLPPPEGGPPWAVRAPPPGRRPRQGPKSSAQPPHRARPPHRPPPRSRQAPLPAARRAARAGTPPRGSSGSVDSAVEHGGHVSAGAQARGKALPSRPSARGLPRGRSLPVSIARRGSRRWPMMSTQS